MKTLHGEIMREARSGPRSNLPKKTPKAIGEKECSQVFENDSVAVRGLTRAASSGDITNRLCRQRWRSDDGKCMRDGCQMAIRMTAINRFPTLRAAIDYLSEAKLNDAIKTGFSFWEFIEEVPSQITQSARNGAGMNTCVQRGTKTAHEGGLIAAGSDEVSPGMPVSSVPSVSSVVQGF